MVNINNWILYGIYMGFTMGFTMGFRLLVSANMAGEITELGSLGRPLPWSLGGGSQRNKGGNPVVFSGENKPQNGMSPACRWFKIFNRFNIFMSSKSAAFSLPAVLFMVALHFRTSHFWWNPPFFPSGWVPLKPGGRYWIYSLHQWALFNVSIMRLQGS